MEYISRCVCMLQFQFTQYRQNLFTHSNKEIFIEWYPSELTLYLWWIPFLRGTQDMMKQLSTPPPL